MSEPQEFWFAARTRKDQELVVRDSLKKLNITCFLPTQVVVRQLKYRKKKVEIPVIRNLVFVHTTKEKACSIPNNYGVQLFYMKDLNTHSLLVVPDRQMHDFMFVMDTNPDGVSFNHEPLEIGEKVQVVKGEFAGIEGELVSVANRSYVIIRIPQVFSVSVRIPKSYLKKIS
jgi:transcription antitermination factor NusG